MAAAGISQGIAPWSVGMSALMRHCLPNNMCKELQMTDWFLNLELG